VGRSSIAAKDEKGRETIVPLRLADRFQVYVEKLVPLAVGDRLRITKNGKSKNQKKLDNGTITRIVAFTHDGGLELDNGATVPARFGHLAHGYVVTSHSSQGKTVDRVLIAQSSESFPASRREQFYVSVSRAKESATVYTDDKVSLRRAIEKSDPNIFRNGTAPRTRTARSRLAGLGRSASSIFASSLRKREFAIGSRSKPRTFREVATVTTERIQTSETRLNLPINPIADAPNVYAAFWRIELLRRSHSAIALSFSRRHLAGIPYYCLLSMAYDPTLGIELSFSSANVRLRGRNLFQLFTILGDHGARWVWEADRAASLQTAERDTVIEQIEIGVAKNRT